MALACENQPNILKKWAVDFGLRHFNIASCSAAHLEYAISCSVSRVLIRMLLA